MPLGLSKPIKIISTVYFITILLVIESTSIVISKKTEKKRNVLEAFSNNNSFSPKASSEDGSKSSEDMTAELDETKITTSFINKRTFACPLVKSYLRTGHSVADLSPEDIEIIAAMGDSVATGKGLWQSTDIEMRGAAFPIGGDADITDIATIPNVLKEFRSDLKGQSHGSGTFEQLPDSQLNCAVSGARTIDLLTQAENLIYRLNRYYGDIDLKRRWLLIIITIGTDETCGDCSSPNFDILNRVLEYLQKNCPRSLVVLVGPIRFHSEQHLSNDILKNRCKCVQSQTASTLQNLYRNWTEAFSELQYLFNKSNESTFGLITEPFLTFDNKDSPESFLQKQQLLLNRDGHAYAARWLWNKLIIGSARNISVSNDVFYCPSTDCPYFRTLANRAQCEVKELKKLARVVAASVNFFNDSSLLLSQRRENMKEHLPFVVTIIFVSALISVLTFGTIFYRIGLRAKKSRFDVLKGV